MKLSFFIYPLFGLLVLGAYAVSGAQGYDPFASSVQSRTMPPEIRSAPQGIHAYPFWYGGYHGGK